MKRYISIYILLCFFATSIMGPYPVYAQLASPAGGELVLPQPGQMVALSPEFNPPILKGIKIDPANPFKFDFILDEGDMPTRGHDFSRVPKPVAKQGSTESESDPEEQSIALKHEATKLIKYFLASLTIPENDLWVNLSPYEKNRIVPESFGQTEMGRDLLAEDYILKQITASLIYPEGETGRKFWKRIYAEAFKKFGTTNIPVNTFNKVWIVPDKAVVYENAKAGTAYVVESKLNVMLEEDYLSLEKHSVILSETKDLNKINSLRDSSEPKAHQNDVNVHNDIASVGANLIREIVIPELNREVNEGKNFVQLRQVYNSLILATWYKKKIKDSILSQVYTDKNKIQGLQPTQTWGHVQNKIYKNVSSSRWPSNLAMNVKATQRNVPDDVEFIYQHYLKAFKKGVYNYIKEDNIPYSFDPTTGEQQKIPRKYFSGGVDFFGDLAMVTTSNIQMLPQTKGKSEIIETNILPNDQAMSTDSNSIGAFDIKAGTLIVGGRTLYEMQGVGYMFDDGHQLISVMPLIYIHKSSLWSQYIEELNRLELVGISMPVIAEGEGQGGFRYVIFDKTGRKSLGEESHVSDHDAEIVSKFFGRLIQSFPGYGFYLSPQQIFLDQTGVHIAYAGFFSIQEINKDDPKTPADIYYGSFQSPRYRSSWFAADPTSRVMIKFGNAWNIENADIFEKGLIFKARLDLRASLEAPQLPVAVSQKIDNFINGSYRTILRSRKKNFKYTFDNVQEAKWCDPIVFNLDRKLGAFEHKIIIYHSVQNSYDVYQHHFLAFRYDSQWYILDPTYQQFVHMDPAKKKLLPKYLLVPLSKLSSALEQNGIPPEWHFRWFNALVEYLPEAVKSDQAMASPSLIDFGFVKDDQTQLMVWKPKLINLRARWWANKIRDELQGPGKGVIYERNIPEFKLSEQMALYSMVGQESDGVYLDIGTVDGKQIPVIFKKFKKDSINIVRNKEIIFAQIMSNLGVGPKFYGVDYDESIRGSFGFASNWLGYCMQFVPGVAIKERDWGASPYVQDKKLLLQKEEINRRLHSAGLSDATEFIVTPWRNLVAIDAGSIIVPREKITLYFNYVNAHRNREDKAMKANANTGGIDLTPENMNVEVKPVSPTGALGDDNGGIKFHIDPAMLKQLQEAPGFVPVVISVKPLRDLKSFLGAP